MRSVLVLALLLMPTRARADAVVEEPPIDCPPGSYSSPSHCGTVCMPRLCEGGGGCPDDHGCVTRAYCVGGCGTLFGSYRVVESTCDTECVEPASCQTLRVCVEGASPEPHDAGPPASPDAGPPDAGPPDAGDDGRRAVRYGCGCGAVGRTRAPAVAALVTLVWLALRRRPGSGH